MMHGMTDPARYPEAGESSCDFDMGNIFRDRAAPFFRVFVTPIKGRTLIDAPAPFIPGLSINFVAQPVGISSRHLLFQLRVNYLASEYFPATHSLLLPTAKGVDDTGSGSELGRV